MARSDVRTLLPLDRFAQVLGVNLVHYNQIVLPGLIPNTVCGQVFKQAPWQENAAISRDDIANAIAEAERIMGDELGYTLLPSWIADERQQTVQPAIPDLINIWGRDVQGFRQGIRTRYSYFIEGGVEAKTAIAADLAITYSDEDGDGWDETATITCATTVTDPEEIAIYYPESANDQHGNPIWLPGGAASDGWEIRPLRSVSIVAGVLTATFWRYQTVIPALLEALVPTAVDGFDDDNFLPSVDVYRHWNDPSQQTALLWSQGPLLSLWGISGSWGGCNCCTTGTCHACTQCEHAGCLSGKDYKNGLVSYTPATWNADTNSFDYVFSGWWTGLRNPDRLRLWYRAGWQDTKQRWPKLTMDPAWERAVVYFAAALLDRELCGCDNLQAVSRHWREEVTLDQSMPSGNSRYQLGRNRAADNPFGWTRGALYAWDRVSSSGRRVGRAVQI